MSWDAQMYFYQSQTVVAAASVTQDERDIARFSLRYHPSATFAQ